MKYLNNILTKKFLYQAYIVNKKSMAKIAKEIGCSIVPIKNRLIKYNIKTRTISEARKWLDIKGKNCGKYKHGESTYQHHCIDCGKELGDYRSKRCKSCSNKGKNNPSFTKGGYLKKYYCIDCGKEIGINSGFYGKSRCKSCAGKKRWQNKEFRENTLKASFEGRKIFPNKPEKLLTKLLNKLLPNRYKFVGDGKYFIAGFVPDFININSQKKIIELYGDYWHNLPKRKEADKRRTIIYKKYGYKTLIIWEHELKNLDRVKNKILKFNKI